MLKTEYVTIHNTEFVHTFTTEPDAKEILQVDTGKIFGDVYDLAEGFSHVYSEIDRSNK